MKTKTFIILDSHKSHKPISLINQAWSDDEIKILSKYWEQGINAVLQKLPNRTRKAIESKASKLGITKTNNVPLTKTKFNTHQESIARYVVEAYGIERLYNHPLFQSYSKKVIWTWVTQVLKLKPHHINRLKQDEEVFHNHFEIK